MLIIGFIFVLSAHVVSLYADNVSYIVDNPTNQRFLTLLADHDLIKFGRSGALQWQDETDTHRGLRVITASGGDITIHYVLGDDEKARLVQAANDPSGEFRLVQTKDGFWVSGTGPEAEFSLASTFDSSRSPIRRSVIFRALIFEATRGLKWSLDDNATLIVPIEFVGMLPQLASVPLASIPPVRVLLAHQALTPVGVLFIIVGIAMNLPRRSAAHVR